MNVELIAEVCHEANRVYCKSIGDNSQTTWDNAPEWQRKSAITGVQYHLDNPNSKPEDSHNSWLREKEADGWKYGPVKNVETKEHPCYVPYSELPVEQQKKDALFIAVVRSFKDVFIENGNNDPLTFGQKAVGLNFNPSGDDAVGKVKQKFADAIDQLNDLRNTTTNSEVKRMCSVAITESQTAQMWAVKAITWRD